MSIVTDIPSVPGELFAKFQTSFYSDPVDAMYKALGVEIASRSSSSLVSEQPNFKRPDGNARCADASLYPARGATHMALMVLLGPSGLGSLYPGAR
jgi:hypothetical protein